MVSEAGWAQKTAQALLSRELPLRWAHTGGVAARSLQLAGVLGPDSELLTAACWMHDIGYSGGLAVSGFHPLDGARYLRDYSSAPELLCRLVAYHSAALEDAARRGLAGTLTSEFAPPPPHLADALTFCDMTTGPDGTVVTVEERLAEICDRYGPDHAVTVSVQGSSAALTAAVRRVTAWVAAAATASGPGSFAAG